MAITVHHTIELGENAMIVALLALAFVAIAFCVIYYPMVVPVTSPEPALAPEPVLPPEPPKGQIGFRPNQ